MRYTVAIKPGSRKGPLVESQDDGSLVVYVQERATEGKANEALVKLLAEHFDTSRTSIVIVKGHTSRYKIVEVGC